MEKKRERKSFSTDEKVKILEKVDSFCGTRDSLAHELKISLSTLNTIVKNRSNITASASESGLHSKKRKCVSYSKYEELKDIIKRWFETARASNIPINGVLLREKALKVAAMLKIENFSASNGWIDRFKSRYNISYKTICGESNDVSDENVAEWINEKLHKLTSRYEPKDIFNIDETDMLFSVLPSKTLAFKGVKEMLVMEVSIVK